eukprot:1757735-Alexandrium_andersonii.AAC.1
MRAKVCERQAPQTRGLGRACIPCLTCKQKSRKEHREPRDTKQYECTRSPGTQAAREPARSNKALRSFHKVPVAEREAEGEA